MAVNSEDTVHDVMQVCRNGHVVTDRLLSCPESGVGYCERCGAATLDRCGTCGQQLAGTVVVPGLVPLGCSRPPAYCSHCGAPFPWTTRPAVAARPGLGTLDHLLRRLPRVVRQLRSRHGQRPPFCVADEHDLEDLLRALLPMYFDTVRLESRTPSYALTTRTDFLVVPEGEERFLAVTVKRAAPDRDEAALTVQWAEDTTYYQGRRDCHALVGLVHDPEGLLRDPDTLETAWSRSPGDLQVHCVIAS